jgi:hypothetical protein
VEYVRDAYKIFVEIPDGKMPQITSRCVIYLFNLFLMYLAALSVTQAAQPQLIG